MSLNLRLKRDEDLEAYYRMAHAFHEFSPFSRLPLSEKKLKEIFDVVGEEIILIFLTNDDKPVGMLLGIVNEPYFSEEKVATELAWWVDPEFRKSKASLDLMYAFEDWAYRKGARTVTLASLTGLSPPSVSKLYLGMGFEKTEETYMRSFI